MVMQILKLPYSMANAMASSLVLKDKVVLESGSALHNNQPECYVL